MEGFLSGFSLAPKPLKGVGLQEITREIFTDQPIKTVLQLLTTNNGLNSWLGETSKLEAHVGIKFETTVNGESSKSVFTALDLPKRVVFMVEALAEFDFAIKENGAKVLVTVKARRALEPAMVGAWQDSMEPFLNNLIKALQHG